MRILATLAVPVVLTVATLLGAAPPGALAQALTLAGRGDTATDAITLPASPAVLSFTHDGSRNFAVWAYVGDKRELLVNTIGAYTGSRPLTADGPVTLDIQADGAWTVTADPVAPGGDVAFSGAGDSVSGTFMPAGRATLDLSHDGSRNFAVWAECAGGRTLVQNDIGPVQASHVVTFRPGPCYWNVQADGAWSISPR